MEQTLIKDLRWQLGLKAKKDKDKIYKVPGRKIVEMRGDQETIWRVLSRSRIAEDLQVQACHGFLARGEKELENNLQKVPWHVFMPCDERHTQYELPRTTAKSFKSKLFHDHLIRNLLLSHISELPIRRAFKQVPQEQRSKYADFKKQWLEQFGRTRSHESNF